VNSGSRQIRKNDVASLSGGERRRNPFHPLADEPFHFGFGAIVALNLMTSVQQSLHHATAHHAQPDKS
jgi:hypothetical protein